MWGAFVLALLAAACSSDEVAAPEDGSAPADDLSTFCASWQELADLVASEPDPDAQTFSDFFEFVDRVEPVLPAELLGDWTAFVGFNRTFRDLLVTVDYDMERVDDDLVARAFGDRATAEREGAAAEAAFDSMENWAATGCGDFCTRWPELSQAVDELGGWLGWVGQPDGRDRLARLQRTVAVGSELVPDAARADWELLVAVRNDWRVWWESAGFDPGRLMVPEEELVGTEAGDLALGILREADYLDPEHLSDFILGDAEPENIRGRRASWEAWQAGSELPEGWDIANLESELVGIFSIPPTERHRAIDERLQTWLAENCDTVGAPGRLSVGFSEGIEDAAGSTLLISLVAEGGSVPDVADPARLIGSTCLPLGRNPWEPFWQEPDGRVSYETWALSAEPHREFQSSSGLCWFGEQQVLAGGDYTLVAAVFPGAFEGRYGGSDGPPPPPTLCLEQPVRIAGDTEVLLASPGPCSFTDWPGDAVDDPWRNPPPVDLDAPGVGTLKVVLPSLAQPEEINSGPDDAQVAIVALAAGTTLNEVGREEVWPLGAVCVDLPWRGQGNDEERRRLDRPTELPLGPVPALGAPSCLEPWWLTEDPPDDRLPLARFRPGEVTVLATLGYSVPGDDVERTLCTSFDVVIDGDTLVDMPAWEECPRR